MVVNSGVSLHLICKVCILIGFFNDQEYDIDHRDSLEERFTHLDVTRCVKDMIIPQRS